MNAEITEITEIQKEEIWEPFTNFANYRNTNFLTNNVKKSNEAISQVWSDEIDNKTYKTYISEKVSNVYYYIINLIWYK